MQTGVLKHILPPSGASNWGTPLIDPKPPFSSTSTEFYRQLRYTIHSHLIIQAKVARELAPVTKTLSARRSSIQLVRESQEAEYCFLSVPRHVSTCVFGS